MNTDGFEAGLPHKYIPNMNRVYSKRSPYFGTVLFNVVLPSLEPPAHTFRALESCWHAGEKLPCCPVTSCGSSVAANGRADAANGRADEEYQVGARHHVRENPLLCKVCTPLRPPHNILMY